MLLKLTEPVSITKLEKKYRFYVENMSQKCLSMNHIWYLIVCGVVGTSCKLAPVMFIRGFNIIIMADSAKPKKIPMRCMHTPHRETQYINTVLSLVFKVPRGIPMGELS